MTTYFHDSAIDTNFKSVIQLFSPLSIRSGSVDWRCSGGHARESRKRVGGFAVISLEKVLCWKGECRIDY
jgi:hypothetical protein